MHPTIPVSKIELHNLLSLTLICGSFFIRIISGIQYRDEYLFNFQQEERGLDSCYRMSNGGPSRTQK
jgi:hypothetical protein